jgi:glycosyltransferase involved in cell wall biosynthesis
VKQSIKGTPVAITPFGIDIESFSPAVARNDKNTLNIGIIKTLEPKYGIKYLIQAFKKIIELEPKRRITLSIYGDGTQRRELEQMVESLGLDKRVRFYGRIPHAKVPDAVRTIDIFCAPSINESFGVAVVEAMACGTPCVTSDADGLTEVMEDGVTGFIVPKKDTNALAEKLILLASDGNLRIKMGQAGRARVQKYYDWHKNLKTIEDALTAQRRRK